MDHPSVKPPTLLPEGTRVFWVYATVIASGTKWVNTSEHESAKKDEVFLRERVLIGKINVEKIMSESKKPGLINCGISLRVPNTLGMHYSSCEVTVSATWLGDVENLEAEVDAATDRIGVKTKDIVNRIAASCGSPNVPFPAE